MKIAIASGKGGTGKTTLSTNLAKYLSEKTKIVLADLDVEEPNSGLFIKGKLVETENKYKYIPKWNSKNCILCGKCQEVCNFNAILKITDQIMIFPELCHSCYACAELCPKHTIDMIPRKMGELTHSESENLHMITSKLIVGEEQAVPLISQTLDYIDENFSEQTLKILDSPPGTSCPVIEATKGVDLVLLITEPTPFGFHDLKLAIDTMELLKKKIGVIINRYGVGNNDVEDYCVANEIPIIAKIPDMVKIAQLYSQGKLLYNEIPEVKSELDKILDFIEDNKGVLE